MAKLGSMSEDMQQAQTTLVAALPPILKPFRLTTDQLVVQRASTDDAGSRHFRYQMVHDGLPVIGGDFVVHVDVKGAIYSVNGSARGDIPASLGSHAITEAQALSAIPHDSRFTGLTVAPATQVFIETADGQFHKAFETVVSGMRGKDPASDKVYIDVDTGTIVADYPQIMFAENRKIYTASNGTSLPGTAKRTEGQAASTDLDINGAYDGTGAAYEGYKGWFNRDSFDNAGAGLTSTVHYDQNYCNAYWNGGNATTGQMVYG
ncbi:MAG TPA: hypothetical protein VFQ65_25815, partial [Kofleriaceae bacterium]|nr:hypothetical protein [Kofleriaceae bacterium]